MGAVILSQGLTRVSFGDPRHAIALRRWIGRFQRPRPVASSECGRRDDFQQLRSLGVHDPEIYLRAAALDNAASDLVRRAAKELFEPVELRPMERQRTAA